MVELRTHAVKATPDAQDIPNAAVEEFLAEYVTATRPLNYAVLLSGPWGSGKTYFLKNFLAKANVRHIYVSLYGVGSIAEVEQLIYTKLHPILSSKAAKLGGLLVRGLVKGAFKVDLNSDGKDDGTWSVSIPEAKLTEFAKDVGDRVLVFDDLERASLAPGLILGFINAFVEHEDMKAIIIANEDELERKETDYKRIKEKLIGQSLRVRPSAKDVLPVLIDLVETLKARAFLNDHQAEILDVFDKSGTENFRVLKQALWDFERLLRAFRPSDHDHKTAILIILKAILALSIQVRTDDLKAKDLAEIESNRWGRYIGAGKDQAPSAFELAEDRYSEINLRQTYVDADLITDLLVNGHVDAAALHASLDRGPPFVAPDQEPAWRRAWNGYMTTDAEYEAAMQAFEDDLERLAYEDPGVVLHVFGVLLQGAAVGLEGYTTEIVVERAKAYVDRLAATGKVRSRDANTTSFDSRSGYAGLGFLERESLQFAELVAYYNEARDKAQEERLPALAARLLSELKDNADRFLAAISQGKAGAGEFLNTPVLHHIDATNFADAFLEASPNAQYYLVHALSDRLSLNGRPGVFREEQRWLKDVRGALDVALRGKGAMTRYRVGNLLRTLVDPIVDADIAPPA